ncbi:phosphatidate cytidylyltransferase [Curvibacter sp. HBC61]|uniref:Phosphatidate cytidylyltransferase n=1 Tax=Curvibacter cyanobacteriorum TaxID=3026422 RepID=A0ABT5MUP9_9BURK|nr:phosphatidate cytidylyltransferase [Curvibacter sp. HBC61]MDD0837765.1 phosphatidate cytidylyltransferase [Curvibacter sp. HBC61]
MLKQRVITALVLLAILLPALFYPEPEPFCALLLLFIAAGGWEWGRMNGLGQPAAWALGGVCLVACALAWWAGWLARPLTPVWVVAGTAWVLGAAALLKAGVPGWPRVPAALRLVGGLLALIVAWLAVAQARVAGINFLLSVLVLVWVADVFAYFAGRAFGLRFTRRKLAPAISPGKSWEGVWGGMAGVVVLAWCWSAADAALGASVPSFYSRLASHGGAFLTLAVVFMGAMSVVGDLVESLIKRSVGIKDSSGLLPGHGGVLDRIDALLPTLPLALMLSSLVG